MVELEMSPDEFWDLSWYEWGLSMLRLQKKLEREKLEREISWQHTRVLWSAIVNHSFSPPEKPVRPQDLIRLSFDQDDTEEKDMPQGETFKELKKKLGSRIKKKNAQ